MPTKTPRMGIAPFRTFDLIHHLEDVFALDDDLDTQGFAHSFQLLLHRVEVGDLGIERGQHGHREDVVQNGLADVVDVRAARGKRGGNLRDDAAAVLAQNGDYTLHWLVPFLACCAT